MITILGIIGWYVTGIISSFAFILYEDEQIIYADIPVIAMVATLGPNIGLVLGIIIICKIFKKIWGKITDCWNNNIDEHKVIFSLKKNKKE